MNKIQFNYLAPVPELKNKTQLKTFLITMAKAEAKRIDEIRYIFCSDKYLLNINRQFLNHDYFTDIISFEMNLPKEPINGEIYISIDRVRDNARKLGESVRNELYRVIFHGMLHFCGFKDKLKKDYKQMKLKEDFYLKRYNA